MALKKNEENAVRTLKESLAGRYSLLDFRIFGSKIRGDESDQSDIDIMIELPESNPEIESAIYDFIFDVNLKNDCLISAVIFGKDEIEQGPLSESPIYKTIMKEGAVV
ncbi:MAG: nucleotidyltransferase domain-containing protein [Acidobacteria bacterium]|jgi:predicted nucleotidyltransferase|nr:nucleotidyltransferase domain-containing protein [Acidobacteriota bacterium]